MSELFDILKHWNPSLRQSINNNKIYISNYCPVCKYYNPHGRHFRYNSNIKVIKCFSCGMSAKNIQSLLHQIKLGCADHTLYFTKDHYRWKAYNKQSSEKSEFEKESRCETEYESALPF